MLKNLPKLDSKDILLKTYQLARWKELPKSIRNIEGYSPTRGKMFFTDINGNHNLVTAVMNIFSSSGNLVSSSNGVKVVGITGAVVTDIEDLVVATVIPGLGKDMPTVQVEISTQGIEHLLPT